MPAKSRASSTPIEDTDPQSDTAAPFPPLATFDDPPQLFDAPTPSSEPFGSETGIGDHPHSEEFFPRYWGTIRTGFLPPYILFRPIYIEIGQEENTLSTRPKIVKNDDEDEQSSKEVPMSARKEKLEDGIHQLYALPPTDIHDDRLFPKVGECYVDND